jgi:hypothetical protein
VTVSWTPCDCVAALAEPAYGHMIAHCGMPGCLETQQISVDALREILEDRNERVAADGRRPCAAPLLDSASRLLTQAHKRQLALLAPDHPGPPEVAAFGSWIQDCVTAVYRAQESGIAASHHDQVTHMEKIGARLATLADAFQMYASLLERSRSADEPALVATGRVRSLAEAADDERVLLACRVATRKAVQQLIATCQGNR